MTLNWMPTVGYSQTATDPASIVGKEIFAKVREKFSGSIDADAPDFVIYLMALDSVFSYIASLKRIYRILIAYSSENHFIPDGMMQALGFTQVQINDLMAHRMQLYQIINELVFMTRKFNVPAVFDIMNRHYWLNDNVYMDADSINSQFYLFRCEGYYQYTLTGTSIKVGGLQFKKPTIPSSDVVDYLFTFGRGLIDALASSDDAYIISGYLMRAYEGTPVFTVDEIPLDDRLVPHYDVEVLMQIENACPIAPIVAGTVIQNDVTQDPSTNAVICAPHVSGTISPALVDFPLKVDNYLSIRSDSPTVADVTIATRLKMGITNVQNTASAYSYDIICGSEILTQMVLFYPSYNGATKKITMLENLLSGRIVFTQALAQNDILFLMTIQSWDWHPILPVFIKSQTTGNWLVTYTGDVHNMTVLTDEQLKELNRICLYSEFNSYGQI